MVEEIRGYEMRFVFGQIGVQVDEIDYLNCVHAAKSNRTRPVGGTIPLSFKLIQRD